MSAVSSNDALICPYCRHDFEDSHLLGEGNDTEDCPACGKEFDYSVTRTATYTSWPAAASTENHNQPNQ